MGKGSIFIICCIALLITIWLFAKNFQCNKPPDHSADKAKIDSMQKHSDSITSNLKIDLQHKDDSLARLNKEKESDKLTISLMGKALSKQGVKVVKSATDVIQAKKDNDTAKYIDSSDSLANLSIDLTIQVNTYKDSVERLNRLNDSLLMVMNHEIELLKLYGLQEKSCCDSATNKFGKLYTDYSKASSKINKRWSVSATLTYGIDKNGKLNWVIGPALGYTLLRF